jgi:predicted MPP superfamily phosphohydrolase
MNNYIDNIDNKYIDNIIKNFILKIIYYEFPNINIKIDNIYCKLEKINDNIYKVIILHYSNITLNKLILEIKKEIINKKINNTIFKFLLSNTGYIYDEFIDIKCIKNSV